MAEKMEKEIEALKTVLNALEPLSMEGRTSVLDYVLKRLQIPIVSNSTMETPAAVVPFEPQIPKTITGGTHIKDLKQQKRPSSANEMAALVAF